MFQSFGRLIGAVRLQRLRHRRKLRCAQAAHRATPAEARRPVLETRPDSLGRDRLGKAHEALDVARLGAHGDRRRFGPAKAAQALAQVLDPTP